MTVIDNSDNHIHAQQSQAAVLNWRDRPKPLSIKIDQAFKAVQTDSSSKWGVYDGNPDGYFLCEIEDFLLVRNIIKKAPREQREFNLVDIGAGNFQWVNGLEKYLESSTDLPPGIRVHIFGLRGEQSNLPAVEEGSRCTVYRYSSFKIEELWDQFQERGHDLENKVDLIVSRWTFRHLVDPVGTFSQAYDLLRPGKGCFLFDGFFFLDLKNRSNHSFRIKANVEDDYDRMTQLCKDTKAPFLEFQRNTQYSLNNFLLQRPNEKPCSLPMAYTDDGVYEISNSYFKQIGSGAVTTFTRDAVNEEFGFPGEAQYCGDKQLYEWIKQNGLTTSKSVTWKPRQEQDKIFEHPALHQALAKGDGIEGDRLLDAGADINESDVNGATPLHIASTLATDAFVFELLRRGANPNLEDKEGRLPIHIAASQSGSSKAFMRSIKLLLVGGSSLDHKAKSYKNIFSAGKDRTPLDFALRGGNEKTIRGLQKLKAKYRVSYGGREKFISSMRPPKKLPTDPSAIAPAPSLFRRTAALFASIVQKIVGGL